MVFKSQYSLEGELRKGYLAQFKLLLFLSHTLFLLFFKSVVVDWTAVRWWTCCTCRSGVLGRLLAERLLTPNLHQSNTVAITPVNP